MPVRSLRSSVLKWPGRDQVDEAARTWAAEATKRHPELLRAAYFGSYAREDWGVGSDLDLFVIVQKAQDPFECRALAWDLSGLPVPAELLVYTVREWEQMQAEGGRLARTLAREAVWLF